MDERLSNRFCSYSPFLITAFCLLIFSYSPTTVLPINATISETPQKAMAQQQARSILTYTNSTLGIKVQYPSDWKQDAPANEGVAGFAGRIFFAPSPYAPQGGPTLYIDVFRNTTLDQLVHMVTPAPPGPNPINVVDGPVKSVPGSFHGNPATLLSYNWKYLPENQPKGNMSFPSTNSSGYNPSTESTTYEVLLSNGNNSYLIAYIADKTTFNTFFPAAQQIINSFEITNPPSQSIPLDTISPGCVFMPGNCVG